MARAHRFYLPGHLWHITHRCHRREFLLKFARDRRRWRYWLFEARKRFGLCVLNYIATSNHIHLLVVDQGKGEIPKSLQLMAGRTAQDYNRRKHRRGAYWEDRYHATAVEAEGHLARCMAYIDMNMVRAGAVAHPSHWPVSGYCEMQHPPKRYRITDTASLMGLLGIGELSLLQRARAEWVEEALKAESLAREPSWSESLAIGGRDFVARFQDESGIAASHRDVFGDGERYRLCEEPAGYNSQFSAENATLTAENSVFLYESL